ncbi:MAG: tetratricopeptide repeat protein [Bacteroidetes bacterium]|nr:MAG: tetratricopeptide repeat protein [Bacteroidota bacterium]
MNKKQLIAALFLLLYGLALRCQSPPYIVGEYPALFKKIEQQLISEDITTLKEDCTTILANQKEARKRGIASFYLGQVAVLDNNFPVAEASYQEADMHFQAAAYEKGLGLLFCKWGELQFLQGDFIQAGESIRRAIGYANKLGMHQVLVDACQIQANVYTVLQQPDSSFSALKQALAAAGFLADRRQARDVLNQLATNYHAGGQLDSAIHYFQQLIQLKKALKDTEGLLSDYPALGNLYRERGSYELAQQQYIEGFRLAESVRDSFSLMTLYAETAALYEAQQITSLAGSNYQKALAIALSKDNDFVSAACFRKLASMAVIENNKPQAIEYYQKALALYEQLGNKISAADVRIELSQCYQSREQYPIAKAYLLDAIAVRQQSRDKLSTLQAKMALAKLEILHGSNREGIRLVQSCISDFKSMRDQESLQQSYSLLATAYQKVNDPQKALAYYQDYMLLKDSLTSVERTRVINELDKKYDTEKKDKEILQQRLEIEQQQSEIQRRNFQLLLLGGGLLLTALLVVSLLFLYRKNQQINQQKIEVLKKEQEAQNLRSIIEGEEKERKRIGRELHDGLGAALATVKMQINSISGKLPANTEIPAVQKAEQLIDTACQTVREISHGMMPYILEQHGLEYALEDMCQTISGTRNLQVHFNPYQVDLIRTDTLKVTIYRIAQELLKNIINHAHATEVIVQLTVEDGWIELLVEDDGRGFDPGTVSKGIGLDNMHSRVKYLKGSLEIDSRPEEGSTFLIKLPLN